LLEFVKSISKEHFLVGQYKPYSFRWEVKADYDNDDYWVVRFRNGSFDYEKEVCGGYAGIEILEINISKERVLELLNTKSLPQ